MNVLLYAVDRKAEYHQLSKTWLENALNGPHSVGFTWNVLLAFLRLGTNSRIFSSPMTVKEAFSHMEGWFENPDAIIINPGPGHFRILQSLIISTGTAGNLTSDAHLAAICIEYSAELCSFDTDFGRFPGLHWSKPGS